MRDGQSDAIHDARVATRRLRAALPLAWADSPNTSWVSSLETIRQLGKHLGRIREVDVALDHLPSLEARVPVAAPAIAAVRWQLAQRQAKRRRRFVKNLEDLSLDQLRAIRLVPARGVSLTSDRRWRALERAIIDHSESLRQAVDAASGVYFPNRAHRVRVATKKLRYVLELAAHPGSQALLKRLRRAQEVLGQLHDHHGLILTLNATKRLNKPDRRVLLDSLEAKCDELFHQYLARRSQLVDVCEHARAAAMQGAWRPRSVGGMLLTASAVAVPSALFWISRQAARDRSSLSLPMSIDGARRDEEVVERLADALHR